MLKNKYKLLKEYRLIEEEQKQVISILKRQITFLSLGRLGSFALEIALFVAFVSVEVSLWQYLYGFSLVVPIMLFMVIVKKQSKEEASLAFHKNLLWVIQNELANLERGDNGYNDGAKFIDGTHTFSSDLDVFGANSLFKFVNRISTTTGMELLADWMKAPAKESEIEERQVAVKELATKIKQSFKFRALMRSQKQGALENIINKVKNKLPVEVLFADSSFIRILVQIVPFVTFGLVVVAIFVKPQVGYALVGVGLINLFITYSYSKSIQKAHDGFSGFASGLGDFGQAIQWTEEINWQSKYLHSFFEGNSQNDRVSSQMKELANIIAKFDARLNMIMNVVLNVFFLWDLKCSVLLSKWFKAHSSTIVYGLERLPKFEVMISVSTLHYNRPNWNFPSIKREFCLDAVDLGHPLIEEDKLVKNDYKMIQPSVDIITGSNMAGKSTFLRAVGANLVLAYLGAPVCSASMSVSRLNLLTYMRIIDALDTNTSTFKAELNRLKMILKNVEEKPDSIVLIDEMLRGTNSGDKFQGSKAFILKMKDSNVPTLFATHDLQLSELETDYLGQIRNFHFDILISENEMRFDYLLKDGPCVVFNAKILLKEIGLS